VLGSGGGEERAELGAEEEEGEEESSTVEQKAAKDDAVRGGKELQEGAVRQDEQAEGLAVGKVRQRKGGVHRKGLNL
jgi:hypothetical protein